MTNANGQTIPADTIKAMGADAAKAVLSLPAVQRDTVLAQVRDQVKQLEAIGAPSAWHDGFMSAVRDAAPMPAADRTRPSACPGCSGSGDMTDDPQVLRCTGCGGIFTVAGEPIPFEAALKFVALNQNMVANAGADGSFYFDLDVLDVILADGKTFNRQHGWADRKTKRVVQWG